MMTTQKFSERCMQLAADLERHAEELSEEVPAGLVNDLRSIASFVLVKAARSRHERTPVQDFMNTLPAIRQAEILSRYAEARKLCSEMAYEIEQLDLCYAL